MNEKFFSDDAENLLPLRKKSVAPKGKTTCFLMIDHRQEAEGQSSRSGWPSSKKQDGYQRDGVSSMTIRRFKYGDMPLCCIEYVATITQGYFPITHPYCEITTHYFHLNLGFTNYR